MKDTDVSHYLEKSLQDSIQKREGWKLEKEGHFSSQRTGALETLTITTSFEQGKGTSLVIFYQWPPCSAELREETVPPESPTIPKEGMEPQQQKEKSLNIGEIPGAKFDFEKRTECSQQLGYVYETYKNQDISAYLKDSLKQILVGQGLKVEQERVEAGMYVLDFSTDTENEKVILQIGFEQGRGNYFIFDYRWPPCSQ